MVQASKQSKQTHKMWSDVQAQEEEKEEDKEQEEAAEEEEEETEDADFFKKPFGFNKHGFGYLRNKMLASKTGLRFKKLLVNLLGKNSN